MIKKITYFAHRKNFAFELITGLAIFLFLAVFAPAQTIVQNDFEDGTPQNWIPRGGSVVLTNTTEAAATGTRSLKTTGRTAGFNGPSLNTTALLTRGTIY